MITKKIRVYGIVQGVGFRPTVSRHAAAAGITGSVCNKGPYVEIFAQGGEKCVKDFLERLEKQPPKRAAILKICLIRRTVDICIHLSTAPAAVPDLRSWMRFHMTGNGPA